MRPECTALFCHDCYVLHPAMQMQRLKRRGAAAAAPFISWDPASLMVRQLEPPLAPSLFSLAHHLTECRLQSNGGARKQRDLWISKLLKQKAV